MGEVRVGPWTSCILALPLSNICPQKDSRAPREATEDVQGLKTLQAAGGGLWGAVRADDGVGMDRH